MMTDRAPWVLVMNATRARILRGVTAKGTVEGEELVLRAEHHRLKDIMADKPGRSFSSGSGGRRSAMAYGSDPLEEDSREFLRRIIDLLESHRRAGDFSRLVVFAEPHVLGLFRAMVPGGLAACIGTSAALNLVHLEPRDLAERVGQELAAQR